MKRDLQAASALTQEPQGHGDGPLLLTQPEVCGRLGISDDTWRRWRKRGITPPPVDLPGHPRWRVEDIVAFGQRRALRRPFFSTARRSA